MQLPFEYATATGPSRWIWAAGEVKHRYRVTGNHQGFNIDVKWDPGTRTTRRWGAPSNSGETETVVRWST